VPKIKLIFADDIMTEHVEVIKKETLIGDCAHMMLRKRVSGYPVVDDEGKLIGIITLTDLFKLLNSLVEGATQDNEVAQLEENITKVKSQTIETIMSKEIFTVAPDTSLDKIIGAVAKGNIHTFPVMKDGKIVGIIGRHDVLNAAFVYA